MDEPQCCSICREPSEATQLSSRPLVPVRFFETGLFDLDPLGTAGASIVLCPACAEILDSPMLLAEDVSAFTRAVELHAQVHPAVGRQASAARIRLWHRALHLGLRALVAEQSTAPAPPSPKAEPDQLGLFMSRSARLAKVETALANADLEKALALAQEVVRRYDLPEARYLAAQLGPVIARLEALAGNPDELSALARHPEMLLDRSRLTTGLFASFARGLHCRAAEAAGRQWVAVAAGQP